MKVKTFENILWNSNMEGIKQINKLGCEFSNSHTSETISGNKFLEIDLWINGKSSSVIVFDIQIEKLKKNERMDFLIKTIKNKKKEGERK